jgi:hypothetical protein
VQNSKLLGSRICQNTLGTPTKIMCIQLFLKGKSFITVL